MKTFKQAPFLNSPHQNYQRHLFFPASVEFSRSSANEAARYAKTLAEAAGYLPSLVADAYLMGGEL